MIGESRGQVLSNYILGKIVTGKAPPASSGFTGDAKKWDAQTTDKAAIKKIVQASFDWVNDVIKNVPDKDLDGFRRLAHGIESRREPEALIQQGEFLLQTDGEVGGVFEGRAGGVEVENHASGEPDQVR